MSEIDGKLASSPCRLPSITSEKFVEGLLPFPMLGAVEHDRYDLHRFELLADLGRIGRHLGPRRKTALGRDEDLRLVAEHEILGKSRGIGVRRQHVDADGAEDQYDRVEQPVIRRRTRHFHVDGEVEEVVEREPVFAGADRAR